MRRRALPLLGAALVWLLLGSTCERVLSVTIPQGDQVLTLGELANLTADVMVTREGVSKSVLWSSDDENVATVSSSGRLRAVGVGSTVVTATSAADATKAAEVDVTVQPVPTRALSVSRSGSGPGTVTSVPAGIDCGSACSADFDEGASVTLSASAEAGSVFAGWSGACSGTGSCTVSMTQARTVTATFNLTPKTLTVTKNGTGSGTITSSPTGINCGTTCSADFTHGTSVTLTAAAATGSTFAGWSGCQSTSGNQCTVSMTQARTVVATFDVAPVTSHALTVTRAGEGSGSVTSVPAGIDCGSACSAGFDEGVSVTLSASAEAGSVFAGWSGACSGTGSCTVSMTQARTVVATFNVELHSLSVSKNGTGNGTVSSSPAGISCGSTCSASFAHGTSVTLSPSAAAGSTFAGWSGSCSGTGTCTVSMTQVRSVTAAFDAAPVVSHALSVSRAGTGSGSVTSSPAGIDCGSACSADFTDGTSVTLTATAASGSEFAGWSGSCSGTGTCTVSMTESRSVVATFNVPPPAGSFTLSVSRAGTGSGSVTSDPAGIDCGSACSADFAHGTSVTLTATAASGSTFAGWSGACSGTGTCSVPMTQARAVTATFSLPPPTLSVSKSGTGSGTVSSSPSGISCGSTCSASFAYGTSVSLSLSPASDSVHEGTMCNGTPLTGAISMTRDVDCMVAFERLWTLTVSRTGAGTITSGPTGIDCGSECTADFVHGANVTLSAVPASGWALASWGGACSGSSPTCTVTMTQARSVSVTFLQPHTVTVDRMYVNQAVPVQDTDAAPGDRIPLTANRAGLVRAFVTADRAGASGADVRLIYRYGGGADYSLSLDGPSELPTSTSEGSMSTTYDVVLPATHVRQDLEVYLTATAVSDGGAVYARYPADGYWRLDVDPGPVVNLTLVPITYASVTPFLGDGSDYLAFTGRVYPMRTDSIRIQIRNPYAFGGDLSTVTGWGALLYDLSLLKALDFSRRHYYGLVDAGPTTAVFGMALMNLPMAASVSTATAGTTARASEVVAHELAHNWGRLHAPCGDPDDVDPSFPYSDGRIGVWGYDFVTGELKSPATFYDLMSYCRPRWVSDYTYRGVMNYGGFSSADVATIPSAVEFLALVTGLVDGDTLHLEPVFTARGIASPVEPGPYTLVAFDAAGMEVARVSFATAKASGEHDLEVIALAVPLGAHQVDTLSQIRLEHHGRVVLERFVTLRPLAAQKTVIARLPDGSVRLTWDRSAYAQVLVRDGVDGPLLARDATGEVRVTPSGSTLELLLSDGLNTVREVVTF